MTGYEFSILRRALESLTMSGFLAARTGRVRVFLESRNSRNGGTIAVDEVCGDVPVPEVRVANGKHAIAIWPGAGEPDLPSPSEFIADGKGGWIGAGWVNGPARWAVGRVPTAALAGALTDELQALGLLEPLHRLPATLGVAVAVPAR